MDTLNNKIDKIKNLYNGILKYSTDISQFHKYELDTGTDVPDEIDSISICLKKIEKLSDFIKNYEYQLTKDNDNIYKNIFEFYNLINLISYKIDNILRILDKITNSNSKDLIYNISDTEIESIGNLYNNIKVLYNKYQTDTIKLDIEIFQNIYNILSKDNWYGSEIDTIITSLTKIVKLYPFAINLYAFIMQQLLQTCLKPNQQFNNRNDQKSNQSNNQQFNNRNDQKNTSLCNDIINNIESVKDFILLESIKINLNAKNIAKSNPHIKTFGLTPSGNSKTLINLFAGLGHNIKSESNLETLATSQEMCIVIVNRIIGKPIEFSLWNLIDWNISKTFIQGEFAGINQKTIDRFKTIMFIETKKIQKWDFSIDYYGDINSNYLTIVEKLGVDAYRLLNIYDRESNFYKTGGGTYETKIHKKHLKSFIEYVTNKGITNNATRISEYHKIQEREILKNMFLPIKFNIAGINMSSQIVDSKYLRYELHKKLTEGFNEIIKKEYKDGVLIKTIKDIGSIMHHKTLSNIFNSILIEQYDIYTFKNKENTNPFPFSETLKTFLSKISLLNRSFNRGVHGNFIDVKIDQNIFSDNTTKKIFLNKLFNDVITRVLEKLISNESNIYQSLIYKNSLLSLSVV